jgi:N-acetyl-alpha-D-muramate 1-phosphate uridylyltransferase
MRALVFAAGLGTRMRPLTDTTPKPLLAAGGKPLIVWHLEKLAAHGVREVVINTAHLGAQFPEMLGTGEHWGLHIHYAREGAVPLETGGGMLHALPWLGDAPFLAINGDIWTDFDLSQLHAQPRGRAQLVMVDNPPQHPDGDFRLDAQGHLHESGAPKLTFAGIGLYRPELLSGWREVIGETEGARSDPPRFPLAPLLRAAMREGEVDGLHHPGRWTDVGTPQRLRELDRTLR